MTEKTKRLKVFWAAEVDRCSPLIRDVYHEGRPRLTINGTFHGFLKKSDRDVWVAGASRKNRVEVSGKYRVLAWCLRDGDPGRRVRTHGFDRLAYLSKK